MRTFAVLPYSVAHPLSLASLSSSIREGAKAAAPLGSPSWRPLQGAGKTIGLQQPTKYTPSASLCSAAPSEREPRRLRRLRVAKLATPTGCRENHWLAATNEVHSLSLALLGSSLREGAKTAAPLAGRQVGDPYRTGANRFLRGIEPGGSKTQRMGTSPVRHCPAALPPNVN